MVDKLYFKSDFTNKTIDPEIYDKLPTRTLPLIPSHPEVVANVKRAAKTVTAVVAGGATVSFIANLLMGVGLQSIWGLLNTV